MKFWYLLVCLIGLAGCGYCEPYCMLEDSDITNMYSSYVEEWKRDCSSSFNKAEKEVFVIVPNPPPDDGTNPDASKCICKGTGIIVQGDGHKTSCPYHGKSSKTR